MNKFKATAAAAIKQQQLQNDFNLAKRIGNTSGFFEYYFEILKDHNTQIDAFNEVNSEHVRFFKEKKYKNYNSFRHQLTKWFNNK